MSFSNSQLAQKLSDLIDYWSNFSVEHKNWLGGVVGGGPNLDGEYPLTDYAGNEILVKSPAQLQDDVDNITTGATAQANAAAASASAASSSASAAAASAAAALASETAADASETAAALSETNATNAAVTSTTQANLATSRAGYAAEWANKAEDSLISVAAGGDNVDDYSALHWANKSSASATASAASAAAAAVSETNAAASAAAAATFDPALYAALADNETVTGFYDFTNASGLKVGGTAFTATSIANWNTAYGWGNHAGLYASKTGDTFTGGVAINTAGSQFTLFESDGVDPADKWVLDFNGGALNFYFYDDSAASWHLPLKLRADASLDLDGVNINATSVGNWNTAYGWGDHASVGYAKLGTLTQADNYLFVNRTNASNPAMYVVQAGAGPAMRVGTGTIGSTTFTDGLDIYGGALIKTDDYLDIRCGPSTFTGFRMRNPADAAIYGYFYADANGIGLLHDGGGWAIQVRDTTHEIDMHEHVYMASGKYLSSDGVWTRQLTYGQTGYEWFNHTSGSVTVNNWYTIATDPSTLNITSDPTGLSGASRASARFKIWDLDSGQHGYIEFEVSCNYHRRPRITILNSSSYGGDANVINAIRVVRYSTYNGVAIQVRAGHTGTLYCALNSQHSGGFHLRDFLAQTPHANWKIDLLDFSSYGSMPGFGSFLGEVDAQTGTSHMIGCATSYLGNSVGASADMRFYPCGPYGGFFTPNNQTYGLLRLRGTLNGYTGICLDADAGDRHTIMSNGTTHGIYNDTDNQWLFYGQTNAGCFLTYNGSVTLQTTSTGARHSSQGAYYNNASASYLGGKITFSTSAASGGSSGDIWFQYT